MKLLELSDDEAPDGPLTINVDHIVMVSPNGLNDGHSEIELITSEELVVKLDYPVLLHRLKSL